MHRWLARGLVFGSSGTVLVLEILAGRLLAPYVGVSLETFTGIIGITLGGIAFGAWLGGVIADGRDPRTMLGAALATGGALMWLIPPLLQRLGPQFGDGNVAIVVLSTMTLFLPAAALSTVTPMVAKAVLRDLDRTGSVVGELSAAGTIGALAGTFVTGFVLVSALPTRPTVLVMGAVLILAGALVHWYLARQLPTVSAAALVLLAGITGITSTQPCDEQTTYFCAIIVADGDNPNGKSLILDGIRHAYVDLDDPTNLDVRYIRLFAQVADALPVGPVESLHIGGGGFSFPRYLEAVRPGSSAVALEIDGALVDLAEDELGLEQSPTMRVEIGDARLAVGQLPEDRYDIVVGDAFSSRAVPWHLTTREFLTEVERVVRPEGIYVMNVLDGGRNRFARAELATLQELFAEVRVVHPAGGLPTSRLYNHVLIASQSPLAGVVIDPADGVLLTAAETAAFVDGESSLRDDFAPVDQLQN